MRSTHMLFPALAEFSPIEITPFEFGLNGITL
jgi:hypothetical protein